MASAIFTLLFFPKTYQKTEIKRKRTKQRAWCRSKHRRHSSWHIHLVCNNVCFFSNAFFHLYFRLKEDRIASTDCILCIFNIWQWYNRISSKDWKKETLSMCVIKKENVRATSYSLSIFLSFRFDFGWVWYFWFIWFMNIFFKWCSTNARETS